MLLRDDSLRTALAKFDRDVGSLKEAEGWAVDYWLFEIVPFFDDGIAVRDVLTTVPVLRRLSPSTFDSDFAAFVKTREFENLLVTRWALGDDFSYYAGEVEESVDAVLERIRPEPGPEDEGR